MATIEKRIEALEQAAISPEDSNISVVIVGDGESTADAIAGYAPDEMVLCVRFVGTDHGSN